MTYTTEVTSYNEPVVWIACQSVVRKVYPAKIAFASEQIPPISVFAHPIYQVFAIGNLTGVASKLFLLCTGNVA
jgi:hypothetical protein